MWRAKITFANQRAALEAVHPASGQQNTVSRKDVHSKLAEDEDRKPIVNDDDDEDAEGEDEEDEEEEEATPSQYGRDTPRHTDHQESGHVLCITREMPDGTSQVEYVRDSRTINAYLLEKKRQMVNNLDVRDMLAVDAVFNDETMDQEIKNMLAQRLGRTLQKTKANLDRRQKASGVQPKKVGRRSGQPRRYGKLMRAISVSNADKHGASVAERWGTRVSPCPGPRAQAIYRPSIDSRAKEALPGESRRLADQQSRLSAKQTTSTDARRGTCEASCTQIEAQQGGASRRVARVVHVVLREKCDDAAMSSLTILAPQYVLPQGVRILRQRQCPSRDVTKGDLDNARIERYLKPAYAHDSLRGCLLQ